MKKLLSILLVTALGTSFMTACAEAHAPETAETSETEETVIETEADAPEFSWEMTDDRINLFEAAMEEREGGISYTPVVYLGVPADNPLGNCFLCRSSAVVPDARPYWSVVTVRDVGSSVTVEDVRLIDYAASSTADVGVYAESSTAPVPGGWEDAVNIEVDDEIIDMCVSAFSFIGMDGTLNVDDVTPAAVLATQVVAGTNYCMLIREDHTGYQGWLLAYIYQDLEGHAEVTNLIHLDI